MLQELQRYRLNHRDSRETQVNDTIIHVCLFKHLVQLNKTITDHKRERTSKQQTIITYLVVAVVVMAYKHEDNVGVLTG